MVVRFRFAGWIIRFQRQFTSGHLFIGVSVGIMKTVHPYNIPSTLKIQITVSGCTIYQIFFIFIPLYICDIYIIYIGVGAGCSLPWYK